MIQILILLYNQKDKTGMHINLIVKETGSFNKPGIIQAIHFLEENKIIVSTETIKHKQMSIKKLTEFGLGIGQLIENIHNYYKSRYKFNNKLNSLLKIQYKQYYKKQYEVKNDKEKIKIQFWENQIKTIKKFSSTTETFVSFLTIKFMALYLDSIFTNKKNILILNKIIEMTLDYQTQYQSHIDFTYLTLYQDKPHSDIYEIRNSFRQRILLLTKMILNTHNEFLPSEFFSLTLFDFDKIRIESSILYDSLLSIVSSDENFLRYYNKYQNPTYMKK